MGLGSLGAVVYDIIARDKTKEGFESAEARAKNMNKSALMVGAGMTAVGVGAKLMADNINKSYLTFDSAMAEVKSLGGVTAEQMEIMRSSAIGISKELPLSATNVAKGFYMMRSAGFEAARVIEELPAIAEMAVAGNLEMADAVNSVTMVLDTYGERAGTAADITNVLMGTVQGFKTTLPELQMQLSKNVGVAARLGIEFHELAAMSGMLKKEFVNAEEAGTGMKTMLLRLVDPKVQAQLEGLGVDVKDANGDFIGMQSVLDDLGDTLKAAGGDVEQMAILQKLFGAEGVRAAMSLIRQKDSLADFSAQVNAGVSVQEALNAVLESTQSQLAIAENKMEAAKIQLGEGMAPATIFAAETMAGFAGILEAMPGPLQELAGGAIIASQSLILIGPALAGIVPAINAMRTAHIGATLAAHAHTAAQWLMNASLYACPLVWIVLAIGGLVAALVILEARFGILTKAVGILSGGITLIADWFGDMSDAIRGVVVDIDKLAEADEELIDAQERLAASEEDVIEAEGRAEQSAEDLAEASAELAAAQLEVADASREVDVLTEAYEELKGAMDDVADETENLDDLERNLRGAKLSLIDAERTHTETQKEHGAGSHEAAKSLNRLETAQDRVSDLEKDRIEIEADLAAANTEATEIQKKNGDRSLEDIKSNLSDLKTTHKGAFVNLAKEEAEYAEARKRHEFKEEDLERVKLVYAQAEKDLQDHVDAKNRILEGETKAGESAGSNLIKGIVKGINSMTAGGRVKNALEAQLEEADKQLPHSDAKEGPFSDLEASGKSVVETFAKGIDSAKGSVGGSFGEAFNSSSFSKSSTEGSGGGDTYGGDSISIGHVSLSADYNFPALMKDIENYQSSKRVQRGIRTI